MDIAASSKRQPWDRLLSVTLAADWNSLRSSSLTGRRVLITGAGGSIGSALARAAAASMPANLILFDSSENGLYQVDRSLREDGSQGHVSILGSVCNADRLDHLFAEYKPEIIFHAAASKHVPLMEQNPFAAIENNVFGTLALTQAAAAHEVEQLMLVSTDKAVDPCSMMGASKRIAELLVMRADTSIRRTVVRLCNVMGSQGSVLPLFLEQIAKDGPVTVTHPEVQRYFITFEETVGALFGALDVATSPRLLLPEIGPAVRILDLARHLIESHQSSAAIEFTGLRPGDRLAEQFISCRESFSPLVEVGTPGLRAIETPLPGTTELNVALQLLTDAIHRHDLRLLLRGIWALVPEYQPSSVITAEFKDDFVLELTSEMQA
jgi:FlaA1/EpsC-like NDP-sugar epimerase